MIIVVVESTFLEPAGTAPFPDMLIFQLLSVPLIRPKPEIDPGTGLITGMVNHRALIISCKIYKCAAPVQCN